MILLCGNIQKQSQSNSIEKAVAKAILFYEFN